MDKLTAIKIKYNDGTYSDKIPVTVLVENVEWDDSHTLIDVLGSIDINVTGTIQDQINKLFNEKINYTQLNNYVASQLNTDVTTWLEDNVNPVGSAIVVDKSLSIEGAAADAKKTGDGISALKEDLSVTEALVNTGTFAIDSTMIESGVWNYTTKAANTKRLRTISMIPVKKGMQIRYTNPSLDVYFGVAPEQNSGATGFVTSGWKTKGAVNAILYIAKDGYLIINFRVDESTTDVTVSDYDCTISITAINRIDIDSQLNSLKDYNAYDVTFGKLTKVSGTHNGVTYTWADNICTVTGTASAEHPAVNVLTDYVDLPNSIVPGNNYPVMYETTDPNVLLRIMFQNSSEVVVKTYLLPRNANMIIPEDAVQWTMALYVMPSISVSNATISKIAVLTSKSNLKLENLLMNSRDDQLYEPKTLCWYKLPNDVESFDAKTMVGNSYVRANYGVLAETFTGTNPPAILTSLPSTTSIIVEKHILNPYSNLYQMIVVCQYPAIRLRMDVRYDSAISAYAYNWLMIERKRIYVSDMDASKVINLDTEYLYFRRTLQQVTNSGYRSMVLPVKKGDAVYLRSRVTSGYTVFAKIKYNYIVDYVYTADTEYDGLITFDYDGYLAFNVATSLASTFYCYLETEDVQNILRESQFHNALDVSNNVLPTYDDNNVCRVLQRGATWMGVIHHWGIIGASFDSGEFNFNNDGTGLKELDWYEYSCWKYLQRINGIPDMYCYSDGGQNARDWIKLGATTARGYCYETDTEETVPSSISRSGIGPGGGCWWKMYADYQSGEVKQAFVLNLGGNDINNENPHDANWDELEEGQYDPTKKYKCGTTADIGTYDLATDTDTLPSGRTGEDTAITGIVNSFAGYMGAILNRLIAIQPDCLIFLCTVHNMYTTLPKRMAIWEEYNELIKDLAEMPQYSGNVLLLDAAEYGPNFFSYPQWNFWNANHPNAMGYVYMAWTWNTMIDYVMQKNMLNPHIKQSMFIGTGKKYTPIT